MCNMCAGTSNALRRRRVCMCGVGAETGYVCLQIWRAHRAQFFKWQQRRVEGDNGVSEGQTGQIKRLQDHIQALRVQFEVCPAEHLL